MANGIGFNIRESTENVKISGKNSRREAWTDITPNSPENKIHVEVSDGKPEQGKELRSVLKGINGMF